MNGDVIENSSTIIKVGSGSHVIIEAEYRAKQFKEIYANSNLNLHVSKNRYHVLPTVFIMRKDLKNSLSKKINLMYALSVKHKCTNLVSTKIAKKKNKHNVNSYMINIFVG